MKLLLDENLPHRLRVLLPGHEVFTVAFMQWHGIGNGELLKLAASRGFDAVLTMDAGIRYQQDLSRLPCSLVVLTAKSNSLEHVKPLLPELLAKLDRLTPRSVIRVGDSPR